MSDQTIRELVSTVQNWITTVQAATDLIGNDAWQDMTVDEFQAIAASENPFTKLVLWEALAQTMRQIEDLPEV